MYKTRLQTTENRIGDYKNKTFYGPPELVPVHPLGESVYDCMDDNTTYIIKTEDGTVYKWFIALYVPENKYENNVRNCVSRTKGDVTTWWEEPCDINEMIYRKPWGICAQYKSDGSIIMHYSKGKAAETTHYYSPKNRLVNAVEGLQSVSRGFDEKNKTVYYPTPNYKMMDYQILAFQNHDLYTSKIVPADEAVATYLKMCFKYVPPEYVPEEESDFHATERYVKYHDRTGGDKPMMLLMTGIFTPEMISAIENGLKDFYIRHCGECNTVINKENMNVCKSCADYLDSQNNYGTIGDSVWG
jgi:hypothetical protein